MLSSYKLPLAFDAESLKADLERIPPGEWVAHFNKRYYEGQWKGLALRSTTGRTNQLYAPQEDTAEAVDTAILGRCPYFRRVLDAFECPLRGARLLSLGPGSKILEHQDYFLGIEDGLIRIHIPVATDARVEFFIDNRRLVMMEGEAWYIDFSLPHRVNNVSDKDRVHLVIDCRVNGWLERMIPFGSVYGNVDGPNMLGTQVMNDSNASVAIVVDPNFGERLASLANLMPVWIADTSANRTCAKSVWSRADLNGNSVTTFRVNGDDAVEWCRTILSQVELHHGKYSRSLPCDSIEVFGAGVTPSLRNALSNYGFRISSEREDGFRAVR